MTRKSSRRSFLKASGTGMAALGLGATLLNKESAMAAKRDYKISLAGWSLHRTIGTGDGKTPALDMPKLTRHEFDIEALELVNQMLPASDGAYIDKLSKAAADNDVEVPLIMVDNEGSIGGKDDDQRQDAVKRHKRWIDIAAGMGCHSIRMNWAGAPRDVMKDDAALKDFITRSVGPFGQLCNYGDTKNINVIIENHGGPSSYPDAMGVLMKAVNHDRFGTLPDFGNFPDEVDNYDAIDRLMRYAKAVSAKCYDFDDESGLETKLDFERLIANVVDKHGYHGYIGIEYEGNRLSEFDGIKACKKLLEKLRG